MIWWCFFFFKQKTAYEMLRSLGGSEMCIRDRAGLDLANIWGSGVDSYRFDGDQVGKGANFGLPKDCLLYTSDAADDLLCVDLRGRRIIKKKKN